MVAPYSGAILAMVARSRHGERRRALAEKFHELAHPTLLFAASSLGYGQHQIGCRHSFAQLALEMNAHHIRGEKNTPADRAFRLRPQCRPRPSRPRRCR